MKIKNPKKISKPIGEGMVKKGGLNSPPTTKKPPPPKGQGGSIPSDEILQALSEIKKNMEIFYFEWSTMKVPLQKLIEDSQKGSP